jgi:hypothetical protein
MFVVLDQDTYRPGDTIEGRLFFEVFMPCFQNRIMLRLEAVEQFPKRFTPKVQSILRTDGVYSTVYRR